MIVTDMELQFASERIVAQHRDRYAIFDDDDPASVRILLRLPAADRFPEISLDAAIHEAPSTAVAPTEAARFTIPASQAASFHSFDHCFSVKDAERSQILVAFFVGEPREKIGTATVLLSELVNSEDERLEVQVVPEERAVDMRCAFIDTTTEFSLEWMNVAGVQLWLEVRVRVDKSRGWPFSTARPFFVVYKWEPRGQTWTPLYRSEVLTKQSDRDDADGAMIFQMAEIFLGSLSSEEDDRPLRFEFFHYKTTDQPQLVASFSNSLRDLRQTAVGSYMSFKLNTFIQGELNGKLMMRDSKVTMKRHFVSLLAEFGGEVEGDKVYFDLSLKADKIVPSWKSWRLRPYYMISRYSDVGKWDHVYRSESPLRMLGNRLYRYKVAKFTEKKLNEGNMHRTWSIMFYYDNGKAKSEPVEIGHIETTVSTLLEAPVGSTFPLETPDGAAEGYIRLDLAEESPKGLCFGATCVLGKSASEDSS